MVYFFTICAPHFMLLTWKDIQRFYLQLSVKFNISYSYMRQSFYPSDYQLTLPLKIVLGAISYGVTYCKAYCPCYAPFVKNGICRFCEFSIENHRVFYLHGYHAKKIQLWWRFHQRKKYLKLLAELPLIEDVESLICKYLV